MQNQAHTALKMKLVTIFTKHHIDPNHYQLWWLGLTTLNNPNDHTIDFYPPQFHPMYQSQTLIRWKQLHYGSITKQWTHYLMINHPEIDATKFFAKILQEVWIYVLKLWEAQNTDRTLATAMIPPT